MPKENKNGEKEFEAYPTRGITLADEVWQQFKVNKQNFGGNWNKFIKHINELLKK